MTKRISGGDRYLRRVLLLAAAVVASLLVTLPGYAMAQSVSLDTVSVIERGRSGSIKVAIEAAEIGAFELQIDCDPVLRFDSISAGLAPSGFTIVDNITGSDSAAVSGFMTTTPITQNLNAASISFTAVGSSGKSAVISVSGAIYDPDGKNIPGVAFSSATVQIARNPGEENASIFPILGGIGGGLALIALIWLIIWNHKRSRLDTK
ncbi:hypothetical protein ACFLTL_00275 [Chloroflexota bacterium]